MDTRIFIEKANVVHSFKYDYSLVNYQKSIIKVKIICPEHGVFEQEPSMHVSKRQGCPKCAGTQRMTRELFIDKSNKIHDNTYDYSLVEYINNKTKVKILCKEHGVFETRPDNHLNKKSGCPKCANNILYNNEDFIKKANIVHNNKYDYSLIKYKTAHVKIKIICHEHGVFEQMPYAHLNGIGCKKCAKKSTIELKEFLEISNNIHKNKYDYSLVDIKTNSGKVKIICPIHGEFEQSVYYHMKGGGCSNCLESKGEKIIYELLDNMNIKYIRQKTFENCKNIFTIPFDFYLPEHDICIEYDGIQHFKPVKIWGGIKALEKQIIRDRIKNQYCKDNNIRLIRIRYNENIEEKLSFLR